MVGQHGSHKVNRFPDGHRVEVIAVGLAGQGDVLVKVRPDGDVFPVRARYEEGGQHTIGLNHLSSDEHMWFTLADCVASKLLTGKAPKVIEALRFEPVGTQEGLAPINIAENPGYRVDPQTTDLYRRVIDLRSEVKERARAARNGSGSESAVTRLDSEQKRTP